MNYFLIQIICIKIENWFFLKLMIFLCVYWQLLNSAGCLLLPVSYYHLSTSF